MNWSSGTPSTVPIVLAQQGGAAPGGNNAAYENGQKVGQVFGVIFGVVLVLWVLGKVFRRR